MSEDIQQYSVSDLLNGEVDYLIPMYQRNYAWGEAEVTQLIQDVLDELPKHGGTVLEGKAYYIGTLVVFRKKPEVGERPVYEVIDGQQRLTILCLLAAYFRIQPDDRERAGVPWFQRQCVRFENRPKSSNALTAIFELKVEGKNAERFHSEEYNGDIINGYQLVQKLLPKLLKENSVASHAFAQYLFSQVQIMRVQVPDDTDLNHYFEIMNNRGEQLEKHEVLKSRLMSKLHEHAGPEESQSLLASLNRVWAACSNMERYVQMGFTREQRDNLFGKEHWGQLKPHTFAELHQWLEASYVQQDSTRSLRLTDIIKPSSKQDRSTSKQEDKEEAPERFNSVINFPNFLLQVLRVTTEKDIPLDDKRLISAFETHILQKEDSAERVKHFIYDLLKCKFLFDQYVIKREYTGNTDAWSLKRLKWQSGSNHYVNTFGEEEGESDGNRRLIMLLSALHVSAPTMVYKHWLNAALYHLYHARQVSFEGYLNHLESITRCFIYDRFLAADGDAEYYGMIYERKGQLKVQGWSDVDEQRLTFGNIANNLVFNYLDYL
ncbi:MAG: DUF262 domain-containing protein, partial [Halomonas sp.]|nr:DUF262 domain-containing protein [Halomonas sp.]